MLKSDFGRQSKVALGIGLIVLALLVATVASAQAQNAAPDKSLPVPIGQAWKDRRPIAQLFLSQAQNVTAANPDGYLNREVDVTTEAGRAAFRKLLFDSADRWIGIMKDNNAQGMIVWDLEGYQQPGMVYVGDPRVLPFYAPEMDEIAHDFFKKFSDAGIRTGVCIRPNKIFLIPPDQVAKWGKWGYLLYDDRKDDVVEELSERITYAQKHWGCTIFYMDSNGFQHWTGTQLQWMNVPASMLLELRRRHPDVLIIPEHPTDGGYEWAAQYNEVRMGSVGTPEDIRKQYPGAFTVISLGGGPPDQVEQHWDALAASIGQGDATFIDGWWTSPVNLEAKYLYRQAAYDKSSLPSGTDTKSVSALLKLLQGSDNAVRFLAVRSLGNLPETSQGDALAAIARDDNDWLVRKEAVVALGKLNYAPAIPVLKGIVAADSGDLGYFAKAALQSIRTAGTPDPDAALPK